MNVMNNTIQNFSGFNITPGRKYSIGKELESPTFPFNEKCELPDNVSKEQFQEYYNWMVGEMKFYKRMDDVSDLVTKQLAINAMAHNLNPTDAVLAILLSENN